MKHIESIFRFDGSTKDEEIIWDVIYYYKMDQNYESLHCRVEKNGNKFWDFDSIPYTNSKNPTKSKSSEILSKSKRLHKEYYKQAINRENSVDVLLK